MAESPFMSWLKDFQYFPLETDSLIFSGNRPPAVADSGKRIPAIRRLAFRYQLFAAGALRKWISHIFLS
jgi:hypothetical protein